MRIIRKQHFQIRLLLEYKAVYEPFDKPVSCSNDKSEKNYFNIYSRVF